MAASISPIIFVQAGQPVGLADAIAEKAQLAVDVEAMKWPDAQALVSAGEADALLQINPSSERDAFYDYSDPVSARETARLRWPQLTETLLLPRSPSCPSGASVISRSPQDSHRSATVGL